MKSEKLGIAWVLGALLLAGTSWSAAAEPGLTDKTIKIGMFGPLTGATSIYGYPINNSAIAVYDEINAKGGIHGRKIEIVHEDDGCDSAKTRAAVKKLIHSDQVFMIHGGNCSAAVFSVKDEFINNKVPFMVMGATTDKISSPVNRYVFTTTLPGLPAGQLLIDFARSMPGVKTIAVVKHANEWADANSRAVLEGYQAAGFKLVAEAQLDSGAKDATAQVLSIKKANPDIVFIILYAGEAAVFLRDALKYDLKGPFLSSVATLDLGDLAQRAGGTEAVQNVYTGSYLSNPVDSEQMVEYRNLFLKYFPSDKVISLNFSGMASARTVIAALEKAGPDLTREKFIDALESIKGFPAGTAPCEITFTPQDHQGCKTGTIWTMVGDKVVNVGTKWHEVKKQ